MQKIIINISYICNKFLSIIIRILLIYMEYYEKKARTVIVTGSLHTAQDIIPGAHFTHATICPHGKNTTPNSPL